MKGVHSKRGRDTSRKEQIKKVLNDRAGVVKALMTAMRGQHAGKYKGGYEGSSVTGWRFIRRNVPWGHLNFVWGELLASREK